MVTINKSDHGKVSAQRARYLMAQASRAELKLATERGELHPVASCKAAAFAEGRKFRDAMFLIPSRVSSLLAAETDEMRVDAILRAEIRAALNEYIDDRISPSSSPAESREAVDPERILEDVR
jgi:hypothetical protein